MAFPMFGIGILTITSTTANSTPQRVGVVKDVSLDISGDPVELFGDKQFAVDVAIGKRSVSGKGKFAGFSADLMAAALSLSSTTGSRVAQIDEAGTPTTNSLTVTPPGSGTWAEDLGVIMVSTGLPMSRVASAPAAGQYSVSAGVYTFAAGDSNPPVLASYSYTLASTGKTVTISNSLMGAATTFGLNLFNNYKSKSLGVRLPAIVIPKLSFGFGNEKHGEMDFEFKAFADSSGYVSYLYGSH